MRAAAAAELVHGRSGRARQGRHAYGGAWKREENHMVRMSVLVNEQQANATFVVSSVATYQDPVVAGLLALNAELPPEDRLEGAVAQQFMTWLGKVLEHKNNALIAAEAAYVAEQADDVPLRSERDEKHEALAGQMMRVRDRVETHFGRDSLAGYGLGLRTPRNLHELLGYAKTGADLLRKHPRTVDDGMGGEVSTVALAESIEVVRSEVESSVRGLMRERRELDAARVARNAAQDTLMETYQIVAGLLIYVFRLAGHPELAERIRPTLRRPVRAGDDGSDGDPAETLPGVPVAPPAK
jgi:hypothetical protein